MLSTVQRTCTEKNVFSTVKVTVSFPFVKIYWHLTSLAVIVFFLSSHKCDTVCGLFSQISISYRIKAYFVSLVVVVVEE